MKKQQKRILAIILVCVGASLVFIGYQMTGGLGSQLSRSVTGSFSDDQWMYFISGTMALALGLFLILKK